MRYWKVIPSERCLPDPAQRWDDIAPGDCGKSFRSCFRERQPGPMDLGRNLERTVITSAIELCWVKEIGHIRHRVAYDL